MTYEDKWPMRIWIGLLGFALGSLTGNLMTKKPECPPPLHEVKQPSFNDLKLRVSCEDRSHPTIRFEIPAEAGLTIRDTVFITDDRPFKSPPPTPPEKP